MKSILKDHKSILLIICSFPLGLSRVSAETTLLYAVKQGLAQGALLLKSRRIEDLIRDPLTPDQQKQRLRLTQEVLRFAREHSMKTGSSYQKFVELGRDWVTQVVIAAERKRFEIKKFEFPVVGAFPYKGYFDENDALREEEALAKEYDVYRRKVPAFSSLGWFSDPLLSTMIKDESELIETLFHELVHLNFYFNENADFSEAFATWFSYRAAEEFIAGSSTVSDKEVVSASMRESVRRDNERAAFIQEITERGRDFYQNRAHMGVGILEERQKYFSWIRECLKNYPSLKSLEKIKWNNAAVLSFSTYSRWIPHIESYALEKNLNHHSLLKEIVSKGVSLAKEIERRSLMPPKKLCAQEIP